LKHAPRAVAGRAAEFSGYAAYFNSVFGDRIGVTGCRTFCTGAGMIDGGVSVGGGEVNVGDVSVGGGEVGDSAGDSAG